jgi:hypothetical protein
MKIHWSRKSFPSLIGLLAMTFSLISSLAPAASVRASHTDDPTSVTVAGSLQDELGCPGDWQPECASTHLGYDSNDDVWQADFDLPAETLLPALNGSDEKLWRYAPGGRHPQSRRCLQRQVHYDHKSH